MSSANKERVEAAPFAAAEPAPPPAAATAPAGPPRWALPALGLLALLALAVVLWLPAAMKPAQPKDPAPAAPPSAETPGPGSAPAQRPAAPSTEASASTPFAEAQAARMRREAQDILTELLDVRDTLVARGAEQWAAEALAAVNAQATEGDALYREREFETAIARYQQALADARALETQIPQQLTQQLEQAREAIEAGNAEQAAAALALAQLLGPDSAELAALQTRLEALPTVLAAMDAATQAERAGDLEAATRAAAEATGADPAHQRAAALLARLQAERERARFTAAMSEGYQALDEARFGAAREAFRRAGKLRSDSSEVSTALAEVDSAETAYTLQSLETRASAAVAEEDWPSAVARYEEAIAIDASVLFAQRGLQQARPRAELDAGLGRLIEQPLRLGDEQVAQAARQTLRLAQSIAAPGPRLQQQIAQLQQLLEQASTPIVVNLRSDGLTEVTLLKVARLGQFEQRSLELRPGEYTAVGARRGYRDVRVNFVVRHGEAPEAIIIACTEAI